MFGAGCFWGVEETFRQLPGVVETEVGYAGGTLANPTYEQLCMHGTGHAEVVRVMFDPKKISYEKLLDIFFSSHNPTCLNYQGPDFGDQYRSVIFYFGEEQKKLAETAKAFQQKSGNWKRPIVTVIEPAPPFYRAEEYHQKYLMKSGRSSCHI